jgi:hypothetical protein
VRRRWFFILGTLVIMLAACGDENSPKPATTTPADDAQIPPGTLSPVYVHLQQDYERLETAHSAIMAVWEGLAAGEEVRCGEYPEVPTPDGISSEGETAFDELAGLLKRAAIETQHAADLWQAECNNPRATPSNSVISEGLLAARTAGDTLDAARETLLDLN